MIRKFKSCLWLSGALALGLLQACGGAAGSDGSNTAQASATAAPLSSVDRALAAGLQAVAQSSGSGNSATAAAAPKAYATTQLGDTSLVNGDFEFGAKGWTQSAANGHTIIGNWPGYTAHSGTQFALLGGYGNASDVLYQDVYVPSGAPQAKLQYAYQILRSKASSAGAQDTLAVDLVNPDTGAVIVNLATYSNQDPTSGWQLTPMFDLTPYMDQLVRLRFTATTNASNPTFFLLDDIDVGYLNPRAIAPQTGWWWNPAEGGRGFAIERQGTKIFLSGFLYENSGSPVWYVSTLDFQADGSYQGPLLRYANGQTLLGAYKSPANPSTVATAVLNFDSVSTGTLTARFSDGTPARYIGLERFPISTPTGFVAPQSQFQTGWWWNAAEGGRGYFIDVQGAQAFVGSFMYDASGQPVWYVSTATLSDGMNLSGTLAQYSGGQTLTSSFKAATLQAGTAGTVSFSFSSPTTGSMTLPNQTKVPLTRFAFNTPATYASAQMVADCAGNGCGAVNANTYNGTGVGLWRFDNKSAAPVSIDLNINGVSGGKSVTLLLSNGSTVQSTVPPSAGLAAGSLYANGVRQLRQAPTAYVSHASTDQAHTSILARNQEVVTQLHRGALSPNPTAPAHALHRLASATPAVNSTRVWTDLFDVVPTQYSTKVYSTCALPNGRNVVFWVDPNALSSGNVSATAMNSISTAYCGRNGGMDHIYGQLGDVWGPIPANYVGQLIQDSPGKLQDINVIILKVPDSTQWGGYFYGYNNILSNVSGYSGSNEALAFFINASMVNGSLDYTISALLHESTHMTNFYQKAVVRGSGHDTWLEETSAMLTEDIIVPVVNNGYDDAIGRTAYYLQTGGGLSYINWPALSGSHYDMGGAFGAFLNRRYGLAIYRELITACPDGTTNAANSSYACLDTLIKNHGGAGLADEFGNFGATVFSLMPNAKAPLRHGYPAISDSGYNLTAIDMSRLTSYASPPQPLGATIDATEHGVATELVPAGTTTYTRKGIVVPANVSLRVIVQ